MSKIPGGDGPTVTYPVVRLEREEGGIWTISGETAVLSISYDTVHLGWGKECPSQYSMLTGVEDFCDWYRIHADDLAALKALAEMHGGEWQATVSDNG